MGLFDFLQKKVQCPSCGTQGARQAGSKIRCPNSGCPYFDATLAPAGSLYSTSQAPPSKAASTQPVATSWKGGFAPARSITIRYRNFKGVEQAFLADAVSARRKRNHISVEVAPKRQRITLSRDRILNLGEVETSFPQRVESNQPWPTRRERQVLGYHKKHHTTSPLYEQIRAKYPNW